MSDPHITVDIETVAPPLTDELRDQLRSEVKVGNRTKAVAEAYRDAQIDSAHRALSLDPLRCQVVTVGMAVDWSDPTAVSLEIALDHLAANPHAILVGHNLAGFDLPVLAVKAARLRHPAARVLWGHLSAKPWERRVRDTHAATEMRDIYGKRVTLSLDKLCEVLGLPAPKPGSIDGKGVHDAWQAGNVNAIVEHVLDDVERERRAFVACCELGIGGWSVPAFVRGGL